MFDPSKPVEYVSANGTIAPARIIATDRVSTRPIVALVVDFGIEAVLDFHATGSFGVASARLRNIVVKTEAFLNVYKNCGAARHSCNRAAMANVMHDCEGTIKLSYEDGILVSVSLVGEE